MATITWDVRLPSGSSDASAADDAVRDLWSDISTGFHESMDSSGSLVQGTQRFPLTGGLTSGHTGRRGGADDGTLALPVDATWFTTSTFLPIDGALQHFGSENTYVLGHAQHEEQITAPVTAPMSARWVAARGSEIISVSESIPSLLAVSYGVTYSNPPYVQVSVEGTSLHANDYLIAGVDQVGNEGFTSRLSVVLGSGQAGGFGTIKTLNWMSNGTVAY